MPNRGLKESILESPTIDRLSVEAERAFYRLLVNVDDFGWCRAEPRLVRSRLFPLKTDQITVGQLAAWLNELGGAGVIEFLELDGVVWLHFVNWLKHNTPRAKRSKCPLEAGRERGRRVPTCEHAPVSAGTRNHVRADSLELELELELEHEHGAAPSLEHEGEAAGAPPTDDEPAGLDADPGGSCPAGAPSGPVRKRAASAFIKPTPAEVAAYCEAQGMKRPAFVAAEFYDYEESIGWRVGKQPMRDWQAAVRNSYRHFHAPPDEAGKTGPTPAEAALQAEERKHGRHPRWREYFVACVRNQAVPGSFETWLGGQPS